MATPKKTTSAAASADGKRILDAIRQLVRALRLFDREAQAKHGITAAQMFMLHSLEGDEVPPGVAFAKAHGARPVLFEIVMLSSRTPGVPEPSKRRSAVALSIVTPGLRRAKTSSQVML